MPEKRAGERTFLFDPASVLIVGASCAAGEKESQGRYQFDAVIADELFGEKSFELAERKLLKTAMQGALDAAGVVSPDIFIGGDLLNQIVSAGYAARDMRLPFLGIYGACSTMAESLLLGAALIDGGYCDTALCGTSSHFGTAERQFRAPVELGTPKTPTAQNTATASGAMLLRAAAGEKNGVFVSSATVGRVIDFGIKEASDMGSAMAPAAAETILTHLADTGRAPEWYDRIITGDLGVFGSETMTGLARECGVELSNHLDCGASMYEGVKNMACGASGCGCGASVLCGDIIRRLRVGEYRRVLFVATGALLSPTVVQQGETIPAVAHAVALEALNSDK